jgi:hypothetical protein
LFPRLGKDSADARRAQEERDLVVPFFIYLGMIANNKRFFTITQITSVRLGCRVLPRLVGRAAHASGTFPRRPGFEAGRRRQGLMGDCHQRNDGYG